MTESTHNEKLVAETAAGRAAAEKALPHLRAQRQELEKTGGALAAVKRAHQIRLIICGAAAGLVGLYSLYMTLTDSPPVVAWIITACLAAGAAFISSRWKNAGRSRTEELDALHAKMHSVGRRIDGAVGASAAEPGEFAQATPHP